MCIRDSRNARGRLRAAVPAALGDEPASGGGTAADGRPVRPVSYTHLRAHETVLDLVCRLLLEKKTRF